MTLIGTHAPFDEAACDRAWAALPVQRSMDTDERQGFFLTGQFSWGPCIDAPTRSRLVRMNIARRSQGLRCPNNNRLRRRFPSFLALPSSGARVRCDKDWS